MADQQVLRRDMPGVAEAMKHGEEVVFIESKFGCNDHLLNWLNEKGFWPIWQSTQPDLKRDGGVPPECLNGLFAAMTLSGLEAIQYANPMLTDGRLMAEVGFNLMEVQDKLKNGEGAIHRDTLRNHLKRILIAESKRAFYEHVALMRNRKWLRGGVYAADGMKIVVTSGNSYEGCGRVWDPDTRRYVYGYKVVYIFNLSPNRPRIVALAVGPINMDERELLLEALRDLRAHVCPPKDMIDVLVLDRGYWGARYFSELIGEFGLDIVTLCRSDLAIHSEAWALARFDGEKRPLVRHITRVNNQGKELRYVRHIKAVEGVEARDETGKISLNLNAACVREVNEETGEVSDIVFLTTLDVLEKPAKIADYYDLRWNIENRCNRELSQKWNVRRPIGRKLRAIFAQICMSAMCLNAVRIYEEQKPKDAEKLRSEMERQGQKSYLLGHGAVVIVPGRLIYATMSYKRWVDLSSLKVARRVGELVAQGMSVEEALSLISGEQQEEQEA